MQPLKRLARVLRDLADRDHCVFAACDLAAVLPGCKQPAVVLSRAVKAGVLERVCKGIFLHPVADYPREHILFHAAARLRASEFNYISLETALSDAGVISQIPIQWITLMSSGRSHIVACGDFGKIEFIHTARRPEVLAPQLGYDAERRLWRASVPLALRDMRATRRPTLDLVDPAALEALAPPA